jgi:protease-4
MAKRGLVIVFTLIGAGIVVSMLAFVALYLLFGRSPSVPAHSVLVLEVGGDLPESAPTDVVSYLRGARTPTVRSIVEMLHQAKTDTRVTAVLLEPTGFGSPYWAKVQELRDALVDFRESGKPIYAYLEYADERNYYLATAADHVALMPSATLDLTGVATYALFLRGTFDKVGVVPDMHHIGAYKTAVNTYTEKTYTAAHKEMDESLNRDLFDQIVDAVSEARGKSDVDVETLIDNAPFLASEALRDGLVDEVAYEDQVLEKIRAEHGSDLARLDASDYARTAAGTFRASRRPRVAVIYASGAIVDGKGGFDPLNGETLGSDSIIEAVRDARKDRSVRAIVLRIDSPGGSASASDAIWRELMLARTERTDRPLIVSMSDLAASGGYYIAMPGEVIVAQPSTLTGSIGIFGGKLVTGGAYQKLGANIEATSIGRNAEIYSPARPFSPSELERVDAQLRAFYTEFVRKVAESRHSTADKIEAIAQGRVWTGRQAKENGLVDELGGLDRAIDIAKERARIPAGTQVDVVTFPRAKSFYEIASDTLSGNSEAAISAWVSTHLSPEELTAIRTMRGGSTLFRRGELLAMMPGAYVR